MGKKDKISDAVVKRLPRYYHCLKDLERNGIARVSSNIISGTLNITASQVRQDFANFGEFGQQGYGYDVNYLKTQIAGLLGLDKSYRAVVIGGGNIGTALAHYQGFKDEGFLIDCVFDISPDKVAAGSVTVRHIDEFENYVAENPTDIAIIATGVASAKEVAIRAVKAGITAIWNFAPIDLYFGENIAVENINMSESLFMLSYKFKSIRSKGEKK